MAMGYQEFSEELVACLYRNVLPASLLILSKPRPLCQLFSGRPTHPISTVSKVRKLHADEMFGARLEDRSLVYPKASIG
jgi:hypothetical protein